MGVTYDQYWYGETWIASAYLKADQIRQERENVSAWLHGVYVAKAIEATICNAFLPKGYKPTQYPDKPIPLKESKEKKEEKEQQEANYALAYMTSFVQMGKSWGKK